jgi:hypothetical protein
VLLTDGLRLSRAVAIALAVALGLAACSTTSASGPRGSAGPSFTRPVPSTRPGPRPRRTSTTTRAAPPTTEQPGWNVVSRGRSAVAVDQRTITMANGNQITLVRFRRGQVRFDLHVGNTAPSGAITTPDAGPTVSGTERPLLLAVFNGGFKQSADAGGFALNGTVLSALRPGLASLVIDANGAARIEVWPQQAPTSGGRVLGVRQNLAPLVSASRPSPSIGDIAAWGATLGGGAVVARSALGQDLQGNIVYAGGMRALPADLAQALIAVGVTDAMELDINPGYVQLALANTAGGPLSPRIPGQHKQANQYLAGWNHDFITVIATG